MYGRKNTAAAVMEKMPERAYAEKGLCPERKNMESKKLADVAKLPSNTLFIVKKDSGSPDIYTVWAASAPSVEDEHNTALKEALTIEPDALHHNRTAGMGMELEDGLVISKDDVINRLYLNAVGIDYNAADYVSRVVHDEKNIPSEKVQEAALNLFPGIIRRDASPNIQRKAVRLAKTPSTVSHITISVAESRQDPEAMGKAVEKCPGVISHLRSDLQTTYGHYAVSRDPAAVTDMRNPSEATVRTALVGNPYLIKLAGKCSGLKRIPADAANRASKKIAEHESRIFPGATEEGRRMEAGKERVRMFMITRRLEAEPVRANSIQDLIENAAKKSAADGHPGENPGGGDRDR